MWMRRSPSTSPQAERERESDAMNASPETTQRVLIAYKWLAVAITIGILIQAVLASQGFFENHHDLITGHGQLGNLIFVLSVIQIVLAFNLINARLFPSGMLYLTGLQAVLILIQIFLGYQTRDDASAIAWHIPNGVLLMAIATTLAVIAWFRPTTTQP
jgi:cytochrome b561